MEDWLTVLGFFLLGFFLILLVIFIFINRGGEDSWMDKSQEKFEKVNWSQDKKLLVIELDKLMEFTLRKKYRSSESLGQILRSKSDSFPKKDLNTIWMVHKARNQLVHDADFDPSEQELTQYVDRYKKIIKKLIY